MFCTLYVTILFSGGSSETLARGPDAKKGSIKSFEPPKGGWKKNTTNFPGQIEFK